MAGVLLAVAAPPMQRFATSRAVVAQAEELAQALRLARSEAMKLGVPVSVCASANTDDASPSCSGTTDWMTGWLVFADRNLNGSLDAGDRLIKVQTALSSVDSLEGSVDHASFHQNGISATGSEPTFALTPKIDSSAAGYDEAVRRVVLNKQGRVQILVGAGDGA